MPVFRSRNAFGSGFNLLDGLNLNDGDHGGSFNYADEVQSGLIEKRLELT